MNSRLQQFLAVENISQASLAASINVAPASISHVLQGRNKPSFDFLVSLVSRFPNLNIDWLLTGKGKMYKSSQNSESMSTSSKNLNDDDNLFPFDDTLSTPIKNDSEQQHMDPFENVVDKNISDIPAAQTSNEPRRFESAIGKRSISKVIVFYDDNTFEEIK